MTVDVAFSGSRACAPVGRWPLATVEAALAALARDGGPAKADAGLAATERRATAAAMSRRLAALGG